MTPNLKHIRLIAIDLDGTLLTSDKQIHPEGAKSISRALEAGIMVCLASGRTASGIRRFVQQLKCKLPIVSCNGAYVLTAEEDEVHHFQLPHEIQTSILCLAQEDQNLGLLMHCRNDVFYSWRTPGVELFERRVPDLELQHLCPSKIGNQRATKILLCDHPENIVGHATFFSKRFDKDQVGQTTSEPNYLEFLPPGVNKAFGVAALAEVYGLQPDQVAAIGDYENDLEMLRWAGFSGAMSGAPESVCNAAHEVYPSNDQGGVSLFIEKILACQ